MKKALLSAALITAFAGAAHAESSVTLYGIIDAGYGYQGSEAKLKGGAASQNGKITEDSLSARSSTRSGTRWGIKGTESLGNGTSALFVLENGFNATTGESTQGGRLFGRNAYVGLTNERWGTFTIGRQYNAGDDFISAINPLGSSWGFAGTKSVFGSSVSYRYDRALKYLSPELSGLQFSIAVVHDDNETEYKGFGGEDLKTEVTNLGVTTGLSYASGPLYIGASFDYIDNKVKTRGVQEKDAETKAWNIGATYDFDVVTLHLLYGGQKDGSIGTTINSEGEYSTSPSLASYGVNAARRVYGWGSDGDFFGDGYSQHSWLVGLSAPVGDEGELMFSYAGSVADNDKMFGGAEEWEAKSHNFSLAYTHSVSKRTSVYGVVSYGWSDLDNNVDSREVETKRTQAIVGLQHRF